MEQNNNTFNKDLLSELRNRIITGESRPTTEETTKQWLVIPFLIALGYNPYSDDIVPGFITDVKKKEKVDYAIQVNNKPVILIKSKKLDSHLYKEYASGFNHCFEQLNIQTVIVTNGNDYWFFKESKKDKEAPPEPYFKIRLSTATEADLSVLKTYSKAALSQQIRLENYKDECKKLAELIKADEVPSWLIKKLAEKAGVTEVGESQLKYCLCKAMKNTLGQAENTDNNIKSNTAVIEIQPKPIEDIKPNSITDTPKRKGIKLNHEYIYNDYSDGTWTYHKPGYVLILGNRYDDIPAKGILINTVKELINQGKLSEDKIKSYKFKNMIRFTPDIEAQYLREYDYISELDGCIRTKHSMEEIISLVGRLLKFAGLPDDSIKISFKK